LCMGTHFGMIGRARGGVAIDGGSVDEPSGLLVMDSAYNWIHEIRLGDYAYVDSLVFK